MLTYRYNAWLHWALQLCECPLNSRAVVMNAVGRECSVAGLVDREVGSVL